MPAAPHGPPAPDAAPTQAAHAEQPLAAATPPTLAALAGPLRQRYAQQKAELLAAMQQARGLAVRGVRPWLARLSDLTDNALRQLWQAAALPGPCALLAVGGYGRGQLFPHSDVDLLLLLPPDTDPAQDPALRQRLEAFISHCWDLGLDIGASVRTPAQSLALAAQDLTVQTALLEARLIAGSAAAFAQFQQAFMAQINALDFFNAKLLELRQRHARYEDTPYALEPNCKESPGGLRDLHIILWMARAAGIGQRWEDLARAGLATPRELRQLRHNEALLSLIRARLHLVARRREDRLAFDLQNAMAESLGLQHRYAANGRMALRASEVLMRRYYWAAKAVTQLSQILLQGLEELLRARRGDAAPPLRPLNSRFADKGGMLQVASEDLYTRQPQAILETFLLYARTPGINGLSAATLRALYNARSLMGPAFRADPANRQAFIALLQQPRGVLHALRLMNQTSVLGRYLWAFRRIVGQMQHDLFHVYTVDQHTLMVLRNMRRFFMAEHAHEYPLCSQLAAGWDKPWLLYTAALFHDIAKGRGGDHSILGAREVRRFCRQHGVARADAQLIEFLVREHLAMSQVAQKQDLSDPQVITAFARRVGNERRLTGLYLLTVADMRGTSPKVWNAWKAKLLQDLFQLTARALGGHAPDPAALIEAHKRQALAELAAANVPATARQALWDTLQVSYFMRHDASDIAWHTRMLWPHIALPPAASQAAGSANNADSGTGTTTPHRAAQAPRPGPTPGTASAAPAAGTPGASGTPQAPGMPDACQARPASGQPSPTSPASAPAIVRARLSPLGEGLQVLVYASDQPDLFARICGHFDRAGFSILDARIHTTGDGHALDTFQLIHPRAADPCPAQAQAHYQELIGRLQTELPRAIASGKPLPAPRLGRASRRMRSFPIPPRIDLRPDDKAQHWLLSVITSDRAGLLYGIARVLAAHHIDVELAKITTLGERVEDHFLLQGAQLQHAPTQLAIERELLQTLSDGQG